MTQKLLGKVRVNKGKKATTYTIDYRGNEALLQSLGEKVRQGGYKSRAEADVHRQYITDLNKDKFNAAPRFVGSFSAEEKLRTVQLMDEFNAKHPDIKLHEVVESGIKAELERLNDEGFPTLEEYVNEMYLPNRLNRPMGTQSPKARRKEQNDEKRYLKPVVTKIGSMRLNVVFKPKTNLKRILTPIINTLKTSKGQDVVQNRKFFAAGVISRMFTKALDDHREILERNPLKGWQATFKAKHKPKPKILTNDQVRALFQTAIDNPLWTECIPYMAFLFFSGARPHEIRGEEAHRIWYWKNMRQWKEPSEKSGGIIFTVPDVDTEQGTGYSMSKPAHETERDLFPAGVEWMKWYFLIHKDEKKLPTTGSYKASGEKWKLIRAANGLGGEDPNGKNYWEGSNPRHLFASCVHRWKKSEKAYWLDVCAHTENVFQKNYKNPDVNKETATDFLFNILPPNINEERETKEKERESRIKYEMETNGWSRADAESIVDADPWATVE